MAHVLDLVVAVKDLYVKHYTIGKTLQTPDGCFVEINKVSIPADDVIKLSKGTVTFEDLNKSES